METGRAAASPRWVGGARWVATGNGNIPEQDCGRGQVGP